MKRSWENKLLPLEGSQKRKPSSFWLCQSQQNQPSPFPWHSRIHVCRTRLCSSLSRRRWLVLPGEDNPHPVPCLTLCLGILRMLAGHRLSPRLCQGECYQINISTNVMPVLYPVLFFACRPMMSLAAVAKWSKRCREGLHGLPKLEEQRAGLNVHVSASWRLFLPWELSLTTSFWKLYFRLNKHLGWMYDHGRS